MTLAEAFRRLGHQTAAVVANPGYVNSNCGLIRGFKIEDIDFDGAAEVTQRAIRQLDLDNRTAPLFLFVNCMDTHRTYQTEPTRSEAMVYKRKCARPDRA